MRLTSHCLGRFAYYNSHRLAHRRQYCDALAFHLALARAIRIATELTFSAVTVACLIYGVWSSDKTACVSRHEALAPRDFNDFAPCCFATLLESPALTVCYGFHSEVRIQHL